LNTIWMYGRVNDGFVDATCSLILQYGSSHTFLVSALVQPGRSREGDHHVPTNLIMSARLGPFLVSQVCGLHDLAITFRIPSGSPGHRCDFLPTENPRRATVKSLLCLTAYYVTLSDLWNHFNTPYVVRDVEELKTLNTHLYTKDAVRGSELTLEGCREILVKFDVCSTSQTFSSSLLMTNGPEDLDMVTERPPEFPRR